MLQIGELIGDLIQAFGFHWRFSGYGIELLRLYPPPRGLRRAKPPAVSHARENPL
jgi:hypothetical protein